jgi:hypothetical protein
MHSKFNFKGLAQLVKSYLNPVKCYLPFGVSNPSQRLAIQRSMLCVMWGIRPRISLVDPSQASTLVYRILGTVRP